jgi:hypothetical protein
MKYFPQTMDELTAVSITLDWVGEQAVSFGLPEEHLNLTNARLKVDKVMRDFLKVEEQAKALGYSSLPMALKALNQLKNRQDHISYLPEVFHTFPHIWLRGKVDSKPKARDGFNPMAPSAARRKYKQIVPLLIEAWQLAERREEAEQIHDAIVREYLSVSAEKFQDALEQYIYDLEPTTLEKELELLPATGEELESTYEFMMDPNRIYGVVSKEEYMRMQEEKEK